MKSVISLSAIVFLAVVTVVLAVPQGFYQNKRCLPNGHPCIYGAELPHQLCCGMCNSRTGFCSRDKEDGIKGCIPTGMPCHPDYECCLHCNLLTKRCGPRWGPTLVIGS